MTVPRVRSAQAADAAEVARLLHDFNSEFGDPSPGVAALAERAAELLAADEIGVLLAGEPAVGIAQLVFRPSVWTRTPDALLEELYVAPARRGEGIGRALLEAALEAARRRGATRIELNTGEADEAAIGLYESAGFCNREGDANGPRMLYYERDL